MIFSEIFNALLSNWFFWFRHYFSQKIINKIYLTGSKDVFEFSTLFSYLEYRNVSIVHADKRCCLTLPVLFVIAPKSTKKR